MAESDGGLAPNACLRCYEIDDLQDAFFRLSYLAQMGPSMAQGCFKMASRSLLGSDPSSRAFLGVPSWFLLIFFGDDDDDAGDGDV